MTLPPHFCTHQVLIVDNVDEGLITMDAGADDRSQQCVAPPSPPLVARRDIKQVPPSPLRRPHPDLSWPVMRPRSMVDAVTIPVALIQELTGDAFKSLLNYKIPVILSMSWVDIEPHTAQKARSFFGPKR